MVECDQCHAWQHGNCMGYATIAEAPADYFCEKCRPDLWQDLIQCAPRPCLFPPHSRTDNMPHSRKYAKRIRQNSAASARKASRDSRSHSPNYSLKQPPKRRNTMNSRDAAYEQQIQALIESTAAEADAAKAAASTATTSPKALTVVIPEHGGPSDIQIETEIVSASRRKRKRPEDDA